MLADHWPGKARVRDHLVGDAVTQVDDPTGALLHANEPAGADGRASSR
jgi:hypothetical protein